MKTTYQYQFYPDTNQKLELNHWLRVSRYWYNRQLGERFTWWQNNNQQLKAFPHWKELFPSLFGNRPNYYNQKLQLPAIKQDLIKVYHSGELLDFARVDSTILQDGKFLPNNQSSKSGLNKSWMDAAFGQFFEILDYIAEKAGAAVISQNPAYTSQVLCYRNEIVFTDTNIREYWDNIESLKVDRDINAAINLKKLGLGIMPRIKRRKGNIVVEGNIDESTLKEIMYILNRTA